jgi:polyisoprenoid-binding protein YceI
MIFKRAIGLFGIGALLFTICLGLLAKGPAAETGGKSSEKKMAALPAPGTYEIDPVHTFAYFGARHHVVGLVRGRFEKVTGTITVTKDPAECGVDINIDVASLTTQNTERDEDVRGPAYFNVSQFPTMTYHGRGIRHASGNNWTMDGSLTLHGVTKVVPLTFTFNGVFPDGKPGVPPRAAFHATAGVKRAEFGMGARDNLDELGTLQSPDVDIQIDVEADEKRPTQ